MTWGDPGLAGVMTTIGFIGSGMIGGTVARLSLAAGHRVVMSNSRGPETLHDLVAELGPLATAATCAQAAEAGDLVVVSIPVKAIGDVPAKPLAGKPVMDTGNYYPQRDGHIEVLDNGALTSSGLLQRYLPDAHVVKVFNNIYYKHLESLTRPSGAPDRTAPDRTALPIAGDDAQAKAAVTAFLDSIGDYGNVRQQRRTLTNQGEVLFWAQFTDGSTGLFLSHPVPEPGSLVIALMLALATASSG